MEEKCQKCGNMVQGEAPNKPWYYVFICDECGHQWASN